LREFRKVFFKLYRVTCHLIGKQVYVYLIAEGRWYMQTLLTRWLL